MSWATMFESPEKRVMQRGGVLLTIVKVHRAWRGKLAIAGLKEELDEYFSESIEACVETADGIIRAMAAALPQDTMNVTAAVKTMQEAFGKPDEVALDLLRYRGRVWEPDGLTGYGYKSGDLRLYKGPTAEGNFDIHLRIAKGPEARVTLSVVNAANDKEAEELVNQDLAVLWCDLRDLTFDRQDGPEPKAPDVDGVFVMCGVRWSPVYAAGCRNVFGRFTLVRGLSTFEVYYYRRGWRLLAKAEDFLSLKDAELRLRQQFEYIQDLCKDLTA